MDRCEASEWCCRLEDLSAAVEVADGMLEHLNLLQASSQAMECFQGIGLGEAVLVRAQPGTLSDEACMAYIRRAVL